MTHPTNQSSDKAAVQKQRLVWVLLLLVVILALPAKNVALGMMLWAVLITVILFALLVLPAILGAAAGSLTGATVRAVRKFFQDSK